MSSALLNAGDEWRDLSESDLLDLMKAVAALTELERSFQRCCAVVVVVIEGEGE